MPSFTIITALDPPTCAHVDSASDDILVLSATAGTGSSLNPDIDSLSVLRKNNEKVPLFRKQPQDPLALSMQRIRGLRERLLWTHRPAQGHQRHDSADSVATIAAFRKSCDSIFTKIRKELEQHSVKKNRNLGDFSAKQARYIYEELVAVEGAFGSHAIYDLSEDCQTVTLQYKDSGSRTHRFHVAVNVSQHDHGESMIQAVEAYFRFGASPSESSSCRKRKISASRGNNQEPPVSLVDVCRRFRNRVDAHQALYDELEDLDTTCIVLDEITSSPWTVAHRRIKVTNEMSLRITLNPNMPRGVPGKLQCIGKDSEIFELTFDPSRWKEDRSCLANLEDCYGLTLPCAGSNRSDLAPEGDTNDQKKNGTEVCAICYSRETQLTTSMSESSPSLRCDNEACGRRFHKTCLRKWLDSLPTSRVSFDIIMGSCPYCKALISAPTIIT